MLATVWDWFMAAATALTIALLTQNIVSLLIARRKRHRVESAR